MIELDVMQPCENCFNFNPVLADDYVLTNLANNKVYHRVVCEHNQMCRNMLKYLEECENKNGR